jgi:hypothetical protein
VDNIGEGGSEPAGDAGGPSSHRDGDRLLPPDGDDIACNAAEGQSGGTA